jgi:WD40 repeat protein
LRAWNIETSEAIASAFGHNSRPFAIEVSNEIGILTAGADQTVCIWQLNNNQLELQKQIVLDGGPIRSLCLVDSKLVRFLEIDF